MRARGAGWGGLCHTHGLLGGWLRRRGKRPCPITAHEYIEGGSPLDPGPAPRTPIYSNATKKRKEGKIEIATLSTHALAPFPVYTLCYSISTISPSKMSSQTALFTQFHANTHPRHAHRQGSVSSNGSNASTSSLGGPVLSSTGRRDSLAPSPTASRSRRASEVDPLTAQKRYSDSPPASTTRMGSEATYPSPPAGMQQDRRMSREWDASKVPPSKFQRPEGKIIFFLSFKLPFPGTSREH